MEAGVTPTVIERWAERIEGRIKHSPLAFCGHTELGPLNQWIHVWAYKDAAERFAIRDQARATGAWPPATRGQFVKQENMFVVPAEFSPLREAATKPPPQLPPPTGGHARGGATAPHTAAQPP